MQSSNFKMHHHPVIIALVGLLAVFLVSTVEAQEPAPEAAPAPAATPEEGANFQPNVDLQESEDEAIGDRIMEEMNGMKVRGKSIRKYFHILCFKEKFDIALSRIGDEIDKNQQDQDELSMKSN